ncbi:MAG: MarR family transcriptional regulator [Lentisphaeria bacterium]|nr:MarR family transcriptional regulator [Lentisphaeria bacterium]NQZ67495.1 MarR family transcriptional regulator [Lentisphaeria bacterium]
MKKIDNLKDEINLDRDFHTDLEHLIMSIVHSRECFLNLSNRYLERYDISSTQFNALMCIFDHHQNNDVALSQKVFADKLLINKASAGTLLERLQSNGWVDLKPSSSDKRAKDVGLTDKGAKHFYKIYQNYYDYLWKLRDGISDSEIASLLKTLQKLRTNIRGLDSSL